MVIETRLQPVELEQWPVLGPISGVLAEARQRLEGHWCRMQLENDDGNVCSIGAVSRAKGMDPNSDASHRWFMTNPEELQFLSKAMDGCPSSIYVSNWNDAHTEAEVLAAFDRAIQLAIAEGK